MLCRLYVEQTDSPVADAAGKFAACDDWYLIAAGNTDLPRVVHLHKWPTHTTAVVITSAAAELKNTGVLKKKLTFLGEKQREPGQVNSLLVGFDLSEIGVCGQVKRHAIGNTPAQVEADLSVASDIAHVGSDSLVARSDNEGFDPEVARGITDLHVSELAVLRDAVHVGVAHDRCPIHLFVLPSDHAAHIHAPGIVVGVEAQGVEGNLELRRPTLFASSHCGVPDAVPLEIAVAPLVSD